MKGQRIGYARVSSAEQNPDRQLEHLQNCDKVFLDRASGKDLERPQLEIMLTYVREQDTVVVYSMDRLSRNLDELRATIQKLTGKGIKVEFIKEHLTFTGEDTPMANLMLAIMGGFAEFERALIRERQLEGISLAKAKGVYKGRKRSLSHEQVEQIKTRITLNHKKSAIANDFGISRQTLYKYIIKDE